MATFKVRYETSLVHTISVEAANAEEAAKLARDRAREDDPEGEPEVYEIADSKGEPVWDSDGNTSFDPRTSARNAAKRTQVKQKP
jgi:hypothetical protein